MTLFEGRVRTAVDRLPTMKRDAALMALVALLGVAACGGGATTPSGGATQQTTPSPSTPASGPKPSPAWPPGGPVPAELAGQWRLVDQPAITLTLSGSDYTLVGMSDTGKGNVVVNGSEIDFFNGSVCDIPLPHGIGMYRWTISAGLLTFRAYGSDPCPRYDLLHDSSGWQRPP